MNREVFVALLLKVFIMLLCIGLIVFYIALLVMYGNKPHNEVPTWVLWLLFRR